MKGGPPTTTCLPPCPSFPWLGSAAIPGRALHFTMHSHTRTCTCTYMHMHACCLTVLFPAEGAPSPQAPFSALVTAPLSPQPGSGGGKICPAGLAGVMVPGSIHVCVCVRDGGSEREIASLAAVPLTQQKTPAPLPPPLRQA